VLKLYCKLFVVFRFYLEISISISILKFEWLYFDEIILILF